MSLAGMVREVRLSTGSVQVLNTTSFFLFRPYKETGSWLFLLFRIITLSESPFFSTFLILKSMVFRNAAKSSKNQFTGKLVFLASSFSKSVVLIGLNLYFE